MTIVSSTEPPVPDKERSTNIREALREWGGTWLWKSLRLTIVGDENWLLESISAGTCLAVTDGSYVKKITREACSSSSGFVLCARVYRDRGVKAELW